MHLSYRVVARFLTLAALFPAVLVVSAFWREAGDPPSNAQAAETPVVQRQNFDEKQGQALVKRLEAIQEPLGPPQPGDWLAEHPEAGQTFREFLGVRPQPVSKELTTFYVQPIGVFTKTQQKLLAQTVQGLELFYGRQVVTLPVVPLAEIPASARRINDDTKQNQILTTYVMDQILLPKRRADAIAVLALTAEDLWPGKGWNYVFGQAYLSKRVGVWSIARFGNPDENEAAYQLCLERMLGTALHESGHMLGIQHCKAWNCCMNGSNNLPESDRHPLWFCAECQPKVWFTCGLSPKHHLAALEQYGKQIKLKPVTEHWKRAAKVITTAPRDSAVP